jgi:hypothetical protein
MGLYQAQSLTARAGFADDFDAGHFFQQGANPRPEHGMIIGQQDPEVTMAGR